MAFREVRVYEVREVLRLWLDGEGFRSIERLSQVDRKTVRRYVTAAEGLGLVRDGGAGQLSDEFIAAVVEVVRPHRSDGHGDSWQQLVAEHDTMTGWVTDGLTGGEDPRAVRPAWCAGAVANGDVVADARELDELLTACRGKGFGAEVVVHRVPEADAPLFVGLG